MMSQTSRSHDRFATTRWSMAARFVEQNTPTARDALAELGARFRYPTYVYARRRGRSPAEAAGLVRGLLSRIEDEPGVMAARDYRRFLLKKLAVLIERPTTQVEPTNSDTDADAALETRFQNDRSSFRGPPEQAFQRSYALVVLERSLERLREEAQSAGHLDMFHALKPFLARDPPAAVFERIALCLHLRHVTVALALKRLRQRLRELAAEELADTVRSAEDLALEQEAMHIALERGR